MATSNRREVELALRVSTPGSEQVGTLADDLREAAGAGKGLEGGLAPAAAALADLAAATRGYRAEEAAMAASVKAAKQDLNEKRDALARLKATYQASGGDVTAYRQQVGTLKLGLVDAKAALRGKQEALTSASAAARTAAVAEKNLADQVRATGNAQAAAGTQASDGLKSIGAQLTQLRNIAGAALGGQVLGGLAGDISRTADQYSNLAARIKLATGEGAAFDEAFAGVFAVANRTNTALESTGTLFTKVAQAGKALGLGVAESLRLTELINQAVQVSGASADSSNAAIVQLIQGLQSGVLRGEEFNSVMEQAPRLAQALADGLGVTTGELRKMAEAGKLTSATVISALRGQSAVLQSEFEKLPATVGRAITTLSNNWTQYVGEVDKANGISTAAAAVITTLAANLDTLGTVLYSAGKAALAYKAVQLAQTFMAHAAAAGVETAAIAANTTATNANSAAKRANAAATVTAGDAATTGAGKFGAAIATFKLAALVGVLTNFREIGTAIGEGTAKLLGYGKSIAQLEAAEKAEAEATRASAAAKAAFAQQLEISSDRALGLTAESKKLVAEFEGMRLKGESAAEALEKLNKNLRLGDIKGITDAGAALDALGIKGELTADQIRDSFTRALKGVDLGVFITEARAAFDDSAQGARRLAAALDGALREAINRSGLDFALISNAMGRAAQSALNDLDLIVEGMGKLQASGVDTGRLLAASISAAIDNADSQAAIESLKQRIESVRKVLGDQIADGFLDQAKLKADGLKDSLDKAVPGINSLREAFKQLGVQAPEDLARIATANRSAWELIKQDGTASAEVLKQAFATYAQSALAASGAAGTGSREAAQAMLQAEAAARGLAVEFDNAGRVIVRGAFDATTAIDKTTRAIDNQTEATRRLAEVNERHAKPGSNKDKVDQQNPYGKTADGFTANKDGSAAGTFQNNLPVDQAFALANGQITDLAAARAAFKQAENAFLDMQAFTRQNPGLSSTQYQQSTQELYTKARTGLERVEAANGKGAISRTVNINLNGRKTAIGVASKEDSDTLVGMLRDLENTAGRTA